MPRQERLCTLCKNGMGDEYHILFVCNNSVETAIVGSKLIPNYYRQYPWMNKFTKLLTYCHIDVYKKPCSFYTKKSLVCVLFVLSAMYDMYMCVWPQVTHFMCLSVIGDVYKVRKETDFK